MVQLLSSAPQLIKINFSYWAKPNNWIFPNQIKIIHKVKFC